MDRHQFRQKRSEIIKLKWNKKPKCKKETEPKIPKIKFLTTSNLALGNEVRLKSHNYQYRYYNDLLFYSYSDSDAPLSSGNQEEVAIVNTNPNENEKLVKISNEILSKEHKYVKPVVPNKKINFCNYSKINLNQVSMKEVNYASFLCCTMDF